MGICYFTVKHGSSESVDMIECNLQTLCEELKESLFGLEHTSLSVVDSSRTSIMDENDNEMVELTDYHIGCVLSDIVGEALGANEKWQNEVAVKRTKSEWGNKIGDLLQIRQRSGSPGFIADSLLIDDRRLDPVLDSVVHFDQKNGNAP